MKSKFKINFYNCTTILLFILLWIVFGFNTNNIDYKNYEGAYNLILNGGTTEYFEIGFYYLIKLFTFFNFSYQQFLICVSFITLLLLFVTIKRLTNNINLTLIVFLIYPLVFDIVQYRNFLGYTICFFGLPYLLKKDHTFKNILIFLALVLVGTSIHKSMIVYCLFILIKIKNNKVFFLLVAFLFSLVISFRYFNDFFIKILSTLKLDAFIRYDFDGEVSTFLQYLFLYLGVLFLSTIYFRNNLSCERFKLLILISVFIPFILLNGTSARFFRNSLVIFYCFNLNFRFKKIYFNHKTVILYGVCLALIFFSLVVSFEQLSSGIYYEGVLKPIIENNLLWGR